MEHLENRIYIGDCKSALPTLGDGCVQLVFTSPPYYNARQYSQYSTYQDYLDEMATVFEQLYRVLEDGRFFVLNTSPVIQPRQCRQDQSKRYPIPFDLHYYVQKVGFEFVDDILWVKPPASAKQRNGGFLQHRKPLMYKPNPIVEYLTVYRKNVGKLIDYNIRKTPKDIVEASRIHGDFEETNVWYLNPATHPKHPAVFPLELAKKVIAYYSFVGEVVLDPFAGTGTTGKAAKELNRRFVLIEQNAEYLLADEPQLSLFSKKENG